MHSYTPGLFPVREWSFSAQDHEFSVRFEVKTYHLILLLDGRVYAEWHDWMGGSHTIPIHFGDHKVVIIMKHDLFFRIKALQDGVEIYNWWGIY
jgi:hypothetical protein